eukprot:9601934-Ditylum_brightwellii.AAC.1
MKKQKKGTIRDGVKTSRSNKKNNNTTMPLIPDAKNKNTLVKIIIHKVKQLGKTFKCVYCVQGNNTTIAQTKEKIREDLEECKKSSMK